MIADGRGLALARPDCERPLMVGRASAPSTQRSRLCAGSPPCTVVQAEMHCAHSVQVNILRLMVRGLSRIGQTLSQALLQA